MGAVTGIINKALVSKFYERNSGFFLFVFYFMFGIVESSQLVSYHLSLMTAIIESPAFLLIVFGIWILYVIRCVAFISGQFRLPENEFLFRLGLLDSGRQRRALLMLFALICLPVAAYAVMLSALAVWEGAFIVAIVNLVFIGALIILAASWQQRRLSARHVQLFEFRIPWLRWSRPRPFVIFYISHLQDQFAAAVWITKIWSLLCILGFMQISLDGYDARVPLLGFLFGLTGHTVLVFESRRFEDQYLFFVRNLPVAPVGWFLSVAAVYGLMLVPEIILLIVNKVHVLDALGMLTFGVSFLLYLHCTLYNGRPDMDRHTKRLLFVFLISFGLVLAHTSLALSAALLALAFFHFNRNYYRYEASAG